MEIKKNLKNCLRQQKKLKSGNNIAIFFSKMKNLLIIVIFEEAKQLVITLDKYILWKAKNSRVKVNTII